MRVMILSDAAIVCVVNVESLKAVVILIDFEIQL